MRKETPKRAFVHLVSPLVLFSIHSWWIYSPKNHLVILTTINLSIKSRQKRKAVNEEFSGHRIKKKTRIIRAHKSTSISFPFETLFCIVISLLFSHCLLFLRPVYWWIIEQRELLIHLFSFTKQICGCALLMLLGCYCFPFITPHCSSNSFVVSILF